MLYIVVVVVIVLVFVFVLVRVLVLTLVFVLVLASSGISASVSRRDTGHMKWDSVSRTPHHGETTAFVNAVGKG